MERERLLRAVADDRVAQVLVSLIETFEAAFGEHNLGYYLIGSFMSRVLRGVDELPVPVDYPEPDGAFFGYDRKRVDAWYPAAVTQGLKEWVSTATRIARALVAVQGGRYVGSKGEAIACYGTVIGDEWSDYLAMLYQKGKGEWGYRVPEDTRERDALRRLCARFVEFERHFRDVIDGYRGIVTGEGIWI